MDAPESLAKEVRILHSTLEKLTGAVFALGGLQAGLLVWAWLRGASVLPVPAWVLEAALLTLVSAAWLRSLLWVRDWTRKVDARLGPGTGKAMLDLGPAAAIPLLSCEGRLAGAMIWMPTLLLGCATLLLGPAGRLAVLAHALGAVVTLSVALGSLSQIR